MTELDHHEFLTLQRDLESGGQRVTTTPFDTLWTEFARGHPRLSPPRSPATTQPNTLGSSERRDVDATDSVDLRELEYVNDYDPNLMCPICHTPFIDPVVLDCDHTFCEDCFVEYKAGGPSTDRSKCPTCRAYHLGSSRKASRLITNMCNDIQVRCPSEGCDRTLARGCVEQHTGRECPERLLTCPSKQCQKKTKRKNFVPEQCVHNTHIECECGASIRLGRGEWIKHKDEDCPITVGLVSAAPSNLSKCPGVEYGCDEELQSENMVLHAKTCVYARLAPAMHKQSLLLQGVQEQLTMSKIRNEVLEAELKRVSELVCNNIQPKLDELTSRHDPDVEEIPRDDIAVDGSLPRRDLLLSTQREELTARQHESVYQHNHQQILNLHDSLNTRIGYIENELATLRNHVTDVDGRNSLALMNETLRIREELAGMNGAMYSTRAQVQWLLNRERMLNQRDAMSARGRQQNQHSTSGSSTFSPATPAVQGTTTEGIVLSEASSSNRQSSGDGNLSSAWPQLSSQPQDIDRNVGSASRSVSTSPLFSPVRPILRRSSAGSSQERVKL